MTEVVGTTAPGPWQTSDSSAALGSRSEIYGEFSGVAGWIDRPWVFRIALGFIALLYLASLTPNWYPTSDSALYLMLGDNLANGEGYTLWGKPHVHVPPGFPLLLAGLKVVGIESNFGRNFVMMLLAWGALACCYLALRELVAPTFAKWLLLLVAISHVMHHSSVCQLSDIPFMAIVWLGLWCQLRGLRTGGWSLEIGSFLLLGSCLFRVVGVPLAIGAAVGLLLQQSHLSRRRIWMNAGGTISIVMLAIVTVGVYVMFLSNKQSLPSYIGSVSIYIQRLWQSGFSRPFLNIFTTSSELSTLLTGQKNQAVKYLILFLWVPVAIGAGINWKRGHTFGVCVFACYLLPLMLLRPLIARYLLPLAPLLFWYTLEGLRWLSERTLRWQPRGQRLAVACALVLLVLNIPKAGKLAYRLHYPKIDNAYKEQCSITEVATFLKDSGSTRNIFITNNDERILSYLSGRWAVPQAEQKLRYNRPTSALLERIQLSSASHFVLCNCGKRSSYRRLNLLISKYPRAKVVFESADYKVFHLEPMLATTNQENVAAAETGEIR